MRYAVSYPYPAIGNLDINIKQGILLNRVEELTDKNPEDLTDAEVDEGLALVEALNACREH